MSLLVGIIMGSLTDEPLVVETQKVLDDMGIEYESKVISAHRRPDALSEYARAASGRGIEVLIGVAGAAAALPGALASLSDLPVIGVPAPSSDLKGIDALLAIAQMPPGIPVATVAISSMGARNAGYLAARILGIKHESIRESYGTYRAGLAAG